MTARVTGDFRQLPASNDITEVSTVKTKKKSSNLKISDRKANTHSQLWHGAARTYTDLTILQWWEKCSLLSGIKHFSQKLSCHSSIVCTLRMGHLVNKKRACLSPSSIGNIISWIKTWNTTGNNTDNMFTIRVWMTMFCFLWSVQSNLFMFDVVCHLLNFPQNLLKFVHCLWIYNLMW